MSTKFLTNSSSSSSGTIITSNDILNIIEQQNIFLSNNKMGIGRFSTGASIDVVGNISCDDATANNHAVTKNQLNGKADATHTHVINDVSNLQTSLDAKANISNPTFVGTVNISDVNISGNLNVAGTASYIDTQNLSVADGLVKIARNNTSNVIDIGQYGVYNDGTTKYTSTFKDTSDSGIWKIVSGLTVEPNTTVDLTNVIYDPLKVGSFYFSGSFNAYTPNIDSIVNGTHSTRLTSSELQLVNVNINCNSTKKIINLANGINTGDAVNKSQLDTKINLSGGTMTGDLNMGSSSLITNSIKTSGNIEIISGLGMITQSILNCTSSLATFGTDMTAPNVKTTGGFYGPIQSTFYENGTARFRMNGNLIQPLNGGRFDSGGSKLTSVGDCTLSTDATNKKYVDLLSNLYNFISYKWATDSDLSLFLNNSNTYTAKVNINNTTTTVNGVDSFVNFFQEGQGSVTNFSQTTTSGTLGFTTGVINPPTNYPSGTESAKLDNFMYLFGEMTIVFSGLSQGNYYRLCIYSYMYDSAVRHATIQDNVLTSNVGYHRLSSYGSGGVITSYIFQNTSNSTSRSFKLTNLSGVHIYAFTMQTIGYTITS